MSNVWINESPIALQSILIIFNKLLFVLTAKITY